MRTCSSQSRVYTRAVTEHAAIADDTAQESAPQSSTFPRDMYRLKIFEFVANHQLTVIERLTQAVTIVEPDQDHCFFCIR